AVNLKALFEVAAHRNRQVEMAETAVGEVHGDEPAEGAEALEQASADRGNLAPQVAGAVYQVAAVRQHEVAALVGFGVAIRPPSALAHHRDRLQVIGHGVAIGRIVIPRLETHALADFFLQKLVRKGDTRVEAAIVADLQDEPGFMQALAKLLALLDADAERLLNQDMLAGGDGLQR